MTPSNCFDASSNCTRTLTGFFLTTVPVAPARPRPTFGRIRTRVPTGQYHVAAHSSAVQAHAPSARCRCPGRGPVAFTTCGLLIGPLLLLDVVPSQVAQHAPPAVQVLRRVELTRRARMHGFDQLLRVNLRAVPHVGVPHRSAERAEIFRRREIQVLDRKSTRLNSSHLGISYAV